MPTFTYQAVDKNGKIDKGNIDAVNKEQAITIIKNDGKTVVNLSEAGAFNKNLQIKFFQKKPKPRELAVFCRQFVSITSAGVPITSALEMLAEQTENEIMALAISGCYASIRSGSSLSESMGNYPKVFPSLLITMVAAGEASGSLENSFDRMATHFEKEAKLNAMVKKSSVYPITIVVVATVVVMLLLAFVIPQFESILTDLGTEMPMLTQIVIAAGDFMQSYWFIVAAVIGLGVFGLIQYGKTDMGNKIFSMLQLKIPLFGKLATKTASARMSRTLATLITAGIPLIDAMEIVANTMSNRLFREALMSVRDDIAMGSSISEPLQRSKMFPALVCHMTKIGEETGDLDSMLTKLADYYDDEVETATAAVMAAIEPAIIIFLALVIGTVVLAVILPMGDMYSGLDSM